MKKLLLKLSFFSPLIALLVSVNYYADPANMFQGEKYEKGIAAIMLSGRNVANLTNFNERSVQKYYVQGLREKKDAVVIGSSRSVSIDSILMAPRTLFNSSVSGASIEDIMAIYGLYYHYKKLPRSAILCLDPWLLNANNGQKRWKAIEPYYRLMQARFENKRYSTASDHLKDLLRYKELFSLSYFQSSVQQLAEGKKKSSAGAYYATDSTEIDAPMKRYDGSYAYGADIRNTAVEGVRRQAGAYIKEQPVYSLGNFRELDSGAMKNLESLIDMMKIDGVSVSVFLAPYHPLVYSYLAGGKEYSIIRDAETYYSRLAAEKKIPLYGSYDPAKIPLGEDMFYDGMHHKPAAEEILFAGDKTLVKKQPGGIEAR